MLLFIFIYTIFTLFIGFILLHTTEIKVNILKKNNDQPLNNFKLSNTKEV